jgi:hypothetical protein
VLAGCASNSFLKPKATNALNIKNLEKNPVSGVYSVKSVMPKPASPPTISKGLTVKEKPKVTSEVIDKPNSGSKVSDIKVSSSKEGSEEVSEVSKEKAPQESFRVDWLKLSLYYLVAFYILGMVYVTYRKGYFIEIKNPFKKEVSIKKVNVKIKKVKKAR